ncbi:hypothetical protein [Comamonas sp. 26]|nr:hypothetical protein [Comamonas sp. 26]
MTTMPSRPMTVVLVTVRMAMALPVIPTTVITAMRAMAVTMVRIAP